MVSKIEKGGREESGALKKTHLRNLHDSMSGAMWVQGRKVLTCYSSHQSLHSFKQTSKTRNSQMIITVVQVCALNASL